jgi:uracil-DNA glycosylase
MNYDNLLKRVHNGWLDFFETNKDELNKIIMEINKDIDNEKIIFPLVNNIFRCLFYFGPEEIKLVLLGQDPYINSEIHNDCKIPQACGLSFSVPKMHNKIPPSLLNIYKEIKSCYPEAKVPKNGFLKRWVTKEKILLLNSALTVVEGKSNSHQHLWSNFTNKLIKYISDKNDKTIFLLMGNFAINKTKLIDQTKHMIFTTVHPSPLSAHGGFFGCQVFLKINKHLVDNNQEPIKWFR